MATDITRYRQILELWEQGKSKSDIEQITGESKYSVRVCIEQYRSLAGLEQTIQNENGNHTPSAKRYDHTSGGVRQYTDQALVEAVAQAFSLAETLRLLGILPAGGNYDTLKRRIKELTLDTSHFRGKGWSRGEQKAVVTRQSLSDVLVKDSTYKNTPKLKARLIAEEYFEARCSSCGLTEWMAQPIPLELDHINGDRCDNRLENLRLLCPNCHALTPTYRGKNITIP